MALLNLWHGRQAKKVPSNMRKIYGFTPRVNDVLGTSHPRCVPAGTSSSCLACSLIRAFDLNSYILQYPMSLLADSEDPD